VWALDPVLRYGTSVTLLDVEPRFLGCTARSVVTVCALLDEIQAFDD
jgi:hypothetical protein